MTDLAGQYDLIIEEKPGMRLIFKVLIGVAIALAIIMLVWVLFYRPYGIGIWDFVLLLMTTVVNLILWPIKFVLQLLGIMGSSSNDTSSSTGPTGPALDNPLNALAPLITAPMGGMQNTTVVKHEIGECPPCNCSCDCPTCTETDVKPFQLEIKYLEDMVKMLGAIARRENAINAQYRELYPGFSIQSPHVQKITHEYNYLKNEIKQDEDEWGYFKNYFSRLSGIPSTSQSVHYDLVI